MAKVEFCAHRVIQEMQLVAGNSIAQPIEIQTVPIRKCLILEAKGLPDKTCYNLDLGTFSCPIAQEAPKT